eukprot:scaffold18502_cov45-Isochrysis_galbana.AAC.1
MSSAGLMEEPRSTRISARRMEWSPGRPHLREVVEGVPPHRLVGRAIRIPPGRLVPVEAAPLVGDCEEAVGGEIDAVEPGGEAELGEGGGGAEAGAHGGQA